MQFKTQPIILLFLELTVLQLKIDLFVAKNMPKTSILTNKIAHLNHIFMQNSKMVLFNLSFW